MGLVAPDLFGCFLLLVLLVVVLVLLLRAAELPVGFVVFARFRGDAATTKDVEPAPLPEPPRLLLRSTAATPVPPAVTATTAVLTVDCGRAGGARALRGVEEDELLLDTELSRFRRGVEPVPDRALPPSSGVSTTRACTVGFGAPSRVLECGFSGSMRVRAPERLFEAPRTGMGGLAEAATGWAACGDWARLVASADTDTTGLATIRVASVALHSAGIFRNSFALCNCSCSQS